MIWKAEQVSPTCAGGGMKWLGRHTGRKFLICGLFLVALLYLNLWGFSPRTTPMKTPLQWPQHHIPRRHQQKAILLLWMWLPGTINTIDSCSEMLDLPVDCRITTNRDVYSVADGVLVYHRDIRRGPGLLPPDPRPPFQHWIWFNMVPPSRTPNLTLLDGLFNLTMSFRRDSDIVTPFGWLTALSRPHKYVIPPKRKMVAWVWRNWRPGSRQTRYYNQLKMYLPVDQFRFGRKKPHMDKVVACLYQYKFYLAFEDDVSKDYITEELWRNALEVGSVPVVLGPPRENYERYLPPEAFIHVEDFPSAQELATFLLKLDRNRTRYDSYFRWRRWWKASVEASWAMRLCRACRVVQEKSTSFQGSWNLSQWFK